jgi:hypothetical protein
MRKAGVEPPYGGKRLTEAELAGMLAVQESTHAKISIKLLCKEAEILPQDAR